MPLQRCQNLNTMKKIKLDELDKDVSSIAEYKKCAIPRYCKENGNIKNHLDELSISNNLYKLGLRCFLNLFIEKYFFCYLKIFPMVIPTTK